MQPSRRGQVGRKVRTAKRNQDAREKSKMGGHRALLVSEGVKAYPFEDSATQQLRRKGGGPHDVLHTKSRSTNVEAGAKSPGGQPVQICGPLDWSARAKRNLITGSQETLSCHWAKRRWESSGRAVFYISEIREHQGRDRKGGPKRDGQVRIPRGKKKAYVRSSIDSPLVAGTRPGESTGTHLR